MVVETIHGRGNNTWKRKQYIVEETIHGRTHQGCRMLVGQFFSS